MSGITPSYSQQSKPTVFKLALVDVPPRAPAQAGLIARNPPAALKTSESLQNGLRGSWFYEVIDNAQRTQTVVKLAEVADWQARLIFDRGTTASQPAGLLVKMTLVDIAQKKVRVMDNITVRVDSQLKTSLGTRFQMGVDLTGSSRAKQLEYATEGKPIMDLATVSSGADTDAGYRVEGSAKFHSAPRVKAVLRSAFKAGASIGKTLMWLDPQTLVRTRLDITLVAKGEAASETGLSTHHEPFTARAEAELQVRITRSDMQQVSAKSVLKYTEMASRWVADVFDVPYAPPPVSTLNHGSTDTARYNITHRLVSGTPVWQLLPHTGGKNHGHPVIDLALRLTGMLRSQQSLPQGGYVASLKDASDRLTTLWNKLTAAQRAQLAPQLANRLNINFGLPEVAWLNATEFSRLPMTAKERAYRALFR